MARTKGDTATLELLNWRPPPIVKAFEAAMVRAASLQAQFAKAIGIAIKESGKDRDQVAAEMSDYLGEDVSKHMLDAYASEAREQHIMNVVRYMALVDATKDARLLQMIAEPLGMAVVDTKYLPAIEEAILAEQAEEMRAKADELDKKRAIARRSWAGRV